MALKDSILLLTDLLDKVKPVCRHQKKHSEKDIHDARVAIKRLKARLHVLPLKLNQSAIFEQLYQLFTDISHALASRRDLDVAIATLLALTSSRKEKSISQSIKWLHHAFEKQQISAHENSTDLSHLYTNINQAIQSIKPFKLDKSDLNNIIQHSWEKTCLAGETALQSADKDDLHSWRKRSKTLQYQSEILEDNTHHLETHKKDLARQGSTLGKLHDLFMLQVMITTISEDAPDSPDMTGLMLIIEEKKHQLLAQCSRLHRSLCYSSKL